MAFLIFQRQPETRIRQGQVTTPAYIKRGHRVIYDEEDLLQWTAQFRKITNTSQSTINQAL